MNHAIELRSVTRTFRDTRALDDVGLSIPTGAICGLLGRNGAGKTTMMSLVAGHDRPSRGEVLVHGEEPFENASVLSGISFVRDNQRYPDDYYLQHVLRIAPSFAPRWDADLAAELVARFRLPEGTPVKKYSRGQLSGVAIVLGLASRAPVTLLDEPYLGLDASARTLFHEILVRDVGEAPRTVLLSTHLIDESESLFSHVVLMDRGRIVVQTDADEARQLATCVTGLADAVEAFCRGREVLRAHAVAGLRAVTVAGPVDDDARSLAADLNVRIKGASLQELAIAHGSGDALENSPKEGVSA
ncbi:multidrug ABC transporter ATPase [Arthrobacter sp. RIT-PI-e]|uniref:ABC transporter ATP-binding protein n=1 Tax=Arthrobacter sp. RIT-PI-e TaxID=1681197 RepID=UPI0006761C24|nr:ABC transporter ATP-binding protein [Arthrobacter sp. RIT-PI-e]KNC19308.1 multidrug ABC transporter ATPase [Arthrobacter sp. RIT-PI-e]